MSKRNSKYGASPPEKLDWFEIINVLNRHLPNDFPLVEKPANTDLLYLIQEGSVIVSVNLSGAIEIQPDPKSMADAALKYTVLNQFTREYTGSREQDFIYANIPFQFASRNFIEMYKSRVFGEEMEEMLLSLGVRDETVDRYMREFEFQFKLHPITKFAKNFLKFDRNQDNRSSYTFDEIITELEVTKNQLVKWATTEYLRKKKGIHIELDTSKIIYLPPRRK